MSNLLPHERSTPPNVAYSFERRKADALKHIHYQLSHGLKLRPGQIANSYSGGMFTKADVNDWIRGINEVLGGGK